MRSAWSLRGVLLVPAVVLGWILLRGGTVGPDGAAFGILAAGGWGLGLVPVHSDPDATGPRRRAGARRQGRRR